MSPSLWSAVDLRAGQQPAAMLGEVSSKQTASLQVSGTEPGTLSSGEKTFSVCVSACGVQVGGQ